MSFPFLPRILAAPFVIRNRYVLLADLCLIPMVAAAAFTLRFDWYFYTNRPEFLFFVIGAVAIKPTVFYWFGMYRRYWRYVSMPDMMAILLASSASLIVMGVFVTAGVLYDAQLQFSRAVLLIDGLLTLMAAAAVRVSVRVVGESRARVRESRADRRNRRVLVVGARHPGALVVRSVSSTTTRRSRASKSTAFV
jgi:FlaA1/EpsC-like NDP-sugar epimerase